MKFLLLHDHKYVASQPTLRRRLYTHFQILIGWSIYLHLGSFGVNVGLWVLPAPSKGCQLNPKGW